MVLSLNWKLSMNTVIRVITKEISFSCKRALEVFSGSFILVRTKTKDDLKWKLLSYYGRSEFEWNLLLMCWTSNEMIASLNAKLSQY